MAYKIKITFIFIILTLLMFWQIPVYAEKKDNHDVYHQLENEESTWINEAFAAARAFLTNSETEVPEEVGTLVTNIKMTIRGVNRILWVLLGGLSAISLSIVGIRYMLGINSSDERSKAKEALHTTIKGMAYGFSAMLIFNIAMIFVRLIIYSM